MRVYVLVLFNNLNRKSYILSTGTSRTEESGHFPFQQYHATERERITHHVGHPPLRHGKNPKLASKGSHFSALPNF